MKTNSFVSWAGVSNWIPIIVSAVTVAMAFGAMNTRLSLIEQKVEQIADQQMVMIELFKSVETRYGAIALKVERLETLAQLN